MASSGPFEPPFRLNFSGSIARTIRQLQKQASAEGRGDEFLKAIRVLIRRLQEEPMEFGEPLYFLPALRLHVRCVAIRPLYVDFAVSADQPHVYLKAVRLLSP
jgi:hypothetical protein